jgi:hypothetical protein
MNKVKKAVGALRNYLGKDRQGLKLLEELSRIVNNVHSDAAATKKTLEETQRALKVADEGRRAAEAVLQEQVDATTHEKALQQQAARDTHTARRQAAESLAMLDDLTKGLPDGDHAARQISRVLHRMHQQGAPEAGAGLLAKPDSEPAIIKASYIVNFSDLVPDVTVDSVTSVGMFVTWCSSLGVPISILTDDTFYELSTDEDLNRKDDLDGI